MSDKDHGFSTDEERQEAEDGINEYLGTVLCEDHSDITLEDVRKVEGGVVAGIEIEQCPRMLNEIFGLKGEEHEIDLGWEESSSSSALLGIYRDDEVDGEPITFIIQGSLSCPEYCDDECDARFYGTIYLVDRKHEQASIEAARKEHGEDLARHSVGLLDEALKTLRLAGDSAYPALAGSASLREISRLCARGL